LQFQNNLLETTYVNTCTIIVTNRAPSSQVGESCPANALRPLPRPPTPASQYLWQNKTIQWLLLPSSLPPLTVCYRDCRVLMHSANLNRNHFWEKRFRWHNPSLSRRDRGGGKPTTSLDKTESLSKVFMCGVSTQKWPSSQITMFQRTRQSAWFDAVTTPLTRSEWILVYCNTSFWRELRNQKYRHKTENALSDALLMSCFQNFAADAAKQNSGVSRKNSGLSSFDTASWLFFIAIDSLIRINSGPNILRSCFLPWSRRRWHAYSSPEQIQIGTKWPYPVTNQKKKHNKLLANVACVNADDAVTAIPNLGSLSQKIPKHHARNSLPASWGICPWFMSVDQIRIIGARFLVRSGIRWHHRIPQQTQSSRARTNGDMESRYLAEKNEKQKDLVSLSSWMQGQ